MLSAEKLCFGHAKMNVNVQEGPLLAAVGRAGHGKANVSV